MVEFRSADWAEKYFSAQSARRSSRVTLSLSYTKQFSSSIDLVAWPVQREGCRGEFQIKIFNEAEEIASLNMGARYQCSSINFLGGFIESQYRKYLSPLQGPRNDIDRTWERSANYSARTFSCSCYCAIPKWSSTIDMSGDTPSLICI